MTPEQREKIARRIGELLVRLIRPVVSGLFWAFPILVVGYALIVVGVLEIWGRGAAFLTAGIMLTLTGIVLVRGLTRGG